MKITIFDPSLRNHQGQLSINLGDVLIYEAVRETLQSIFPGAEFNRLSTHQFPEEHHYRQIDASDLVFVGGTNLLSSDVRTYNQWKLNRDEDDHRSPRISDVILFGVGWWQYQGLPTPDTKSYYEKILSRSSLHSVRDSYTKHRLSSMGIHNALNTSCPTLWKLHDLDTNRGGRERQHCLFTFTDYYRDPVADTEMLEIILRNYPGRIYYFPQGTEDVAYLHSLEIYGSHREQITLLDHNVDALNEVIRDGDINYIGTRLHCGIKCLQNGIAAIIIAVDNRAAEIEKDVNLPVISRKELYRLQDWLDGKHLFDRIKLPLEAIKKWKRQFVN